MSKKKMHSRVATTGSTWCGLQISPETMLANEDAPEAVTCKNCIRADPELGETATPRPPAPSGDPYQDFADKLAAEGVPAASMLLDRPARKIAQLDIGYGVGTQPFSDYRKSITVKPFARTAENRRKSWRRTL